MSSSSVMSVSSEISMEESLQCLKASEEDDDKSIPIEALLEKQDALNSKIKSFDENELPPYVDSKAVNKFTYGTPEAHNVESQSNGPSVKRIIENFNKKNISSSKTPSEVKKPTFYIPRNSTSPYFSTPPPTHTVDTIKDNSKHSFNPSFKPTNYASPLIHVKAENNTNSFDKRPKFYVPSSPAHILSESKPLPKVIETPSPPRELHLHQTATTSTAGSSLSKPKPKFYVSSSPARLLPSPPHNEIYSPPIPPEFSTPDKTNGKVSKTIKVSPNRPPIFTPEKKGIDKEETPLIAANSELLKPWRVPYDHALKFIQGKEEGSLHVDDLITIRLQLAMAKRQVEQRLLEVEAIDHQDLMRIWRLVYELEEEEFAMSSSIGGEERVAKDMVLMHQQLVKLVGLIYSFLILLFNYY